MGSARRQFGEDGAFRRTDRWLEFKKDIEELIQDFEREDGDSQKKYFDHVDLAVFWSAKAGSSGQYAIEAVTDANWPERNFFGTTYYAILENQNHRIEVLCLSDLVQQLNLTDVGEGGQGV